MAIECVEKLRSVVDRLPDKDKTFAQSLLNSVAKYRLPTVKQEYWIKELYNRAVNPPEAPKGESVGDLSRLVTMFTTVKTHLKFPSIRFQTQDGKTFKISPAGDASANKGWLYVKNGSDYLGKISPTGQYHQSRQVAVEGVAEAIRDFAENPERAAASYGHSVGQCCFCGLTLTDERSVKVGYGPICADHYGLAWGER
jgi:hypothetical protein